MNRVAVYILVTGPPVRIERIHPRSLPPRSEITVGQDYAQRLAATKDYDLFVSEAGPVGQALGSFSPEHFRLQVSGPFDDGNSWELACFAAHALAKHSRLAEADDDVDAVLLLTGRVDLALAVGAVGHLGDKVRSAHEVIESWQSKGLPVTLVVPEADNPPDALPGNVEVMRCASVGDLMDRLELPCRGSTLPPVEPPAPKTRTSVVVPVLVVLVFVAGGFGLAVTNQGQALLQRAGFGPQKTVAPEPPAPKVEPKLKSPPPAKPEKLVAVSPPTATLVVFERRAPEGRTCAHVHFGDVAAELTLLAPDGDGRLPESTPDELCGLTFEATVEADTDSVVWLERHSGDYLSARDGSRVEAPRAFKGSYRWGIDLPKRMPAPLDYRVVLIAGSGVELENPSELDAVRKAGGLVITLEHRVGN